MDRRQALAAAGSAALVLAAGCIGEADDPTIDGEWILRARVRNGDDQPREWRVESRSQGRDSAAAAYGTLPAGESTEAELRGLVREETREVYVESDAGAVSEPWRPTVCRDVFADVGISDGMPRLQTECRERE